MPDPGTPNHPEPTVVPDNGGWAVFCAACGGLWSDNHGHVLAWPFRHQAEVAATRHKGMVGHG